MEMIIYGLIYIFASINLVARGNHRRALSPVCLHHGDRGDVLPGDDEHLQNDDDDDNDEEHKAAAAGPEREKVSAQMSPSLIRTIRSGPKQRERRVKVNVR